MTVSDPTTIRRLYGRRQGHPLRLGQAALVERLLPVLSVPPTGTLCSRALFGDNRPLWLEIGFGAGEHMSWQAQANPDTGVIGCEPFLNGVAAALGHLDRGATANVRIHMGDALEVLGRLPDQSLARAFLLHPDPWPKARHAKRRFVNPGPLELLAAKLEPGAEFRIGTDDPTYLRWTLMQMSRHRVFRWLAEAAQDWIEPPRDWPETRYASKARRQGRSVWHLRYRKL